MQARSRSQGAEDSHDRGQVIWDRIPVFTLARRCHRRPNFVLGNLLTIPELWKLCPPKNEDHLTSSPAVLLLSTIRLSIRPSTPQSKCELPNASTPTHTSTARQHGTPRKRIADGMGVQRQTARGPYKPICFFRVKPESTTM